MNLHLPLTGKRLHLAFYDAAQGGPVRTLRQAWRLHRIGQLAVEWDIQP